MKKILLVFFLLALTGSVFAQKTETETESSSDDEAADDFGGAIKIMVIPFNPSYYKRDLSADLKEYQEKYNEKKSGEIKAWFSFGLDENIAPRILTLNNAEKKMPLLNDLSNDLDNDIKVIYSNIEYRYEKRDKKYEKKNASLVSNVMGKLKQSKAGTEMNIEEDYESDKKHKEYMNVYIADPTVLPHVAERFGVQLFVFINQFEIFTDYKKCIDKENKIFQRQIKLHFSIFDKDGDQIYGDLATINFYPTANKNIDDIIMERFPIVGNYLSKAFPDGAGQ